MCFLDRGTHITRDMCFTAGGTHNARDMCFLVWEHISLERRKMCFYGQENVFYDVLEQKNAFLGSKNKKFKKTNK